MWMMIRDQRGHLRTWTLLICFETLRNLNYLTVPFLLAWKGGGAGRGGGGGVSYCHDVNLSSRSQANVSGFKQQKATCAMLKLIWRKLTKNNTTTTTTITTTTTNNNNNNNNNNNTNTKNNNNVQQQEQNNNNTTTTTTNNNNNNNVQQQEQGLQFQEKRQTQVCQTTKKPRLCYRRSTPVPSLASDPYNKYT